MGKKEGLHVKMRFFSISLDIFNPTIQCLAFHLWVFDIMHRLYSNNNSLLLCYLLFLLQVFSVTALHVFSIVSLKRADLIV